MQTITRRHLALAPFALALALLPACGADAPTCEPQAEVPAARPSATAPAVTAPPAAPTIATKPATVTAPPPRARVREPEPDVDRRAELSVKRLVVAQGVENREPVGASNAFVQGEAKRVYAFVEVGNRSEVDSEVEVRFVKEGEAERGGVHLHVGPSPRWRTWAYSERVREVGRWNVIVRDGDGDLIARTAFEITADGNSIYPLDPPADGGKQAKSGEATTSRGG